MKYESILEKDREMKEKLMTVTVSMQQKEQDLADVTNLNFNLQTVVNQRDGKMKALEDMIALE